MHTTRRTLIKGAALSPLALALTRLPVGAQDAIKVGSKDFPESIIIGEIYAQLLENAGLKVERKLNLGGTVIAQAALLAGDLDLYPEYTGTGLLVVLGEALADVPGLGGTPTAGTAVASPTASDPSTAVYDYVKQRYQEEYNLVWLDQTPMNDTQALAVTRAFAEEHSLTTISDLVALASTVDLRASRFRRSRRWPQGVARDVRRFSGHGQRCRAWHQIPGTHGRRRECRARFLD